MCSCVCINTLAYVLISILLLNQPIASYTLNYMLTIVIVTENINFRTHAYIRVFVYCVLVSIARATV